MDKPPGFLDRFRHKRYLYLALMQAALSEEVSDGKSSISRSYGPLSAQRRRPGFQGSGYGAAGIPCFDGAASLKQTRDEVIANIHKIDQDRKKWAQYLYGVDWEDASLYDIVHQSRAHGHR